jgi:hypothetical protein
VWRRHRAEQSIDRDAERGRQLSEGGGPAGRPGALLNARHSVDADRGSFGKPLL